MLFLKKKKEKKDGKSLASRLVPLDIFNKDVHVQILLPIIKKKNKKRVIILSSLEV